MNEDSNGGHLEHRPSTVMEVRQREGKLGGRGGGEARKESNDAHPERHFFNFIGGEAERE